MSYLEFLLVFLIPPILVLAFVQPRPMAEVGAASAWKWLVLLCGIAFLYTTPWDNYLVYRGVWSYGPDRVLGTIAYVPVEEYLFFILQTIMTGLWTFFLLGRQGSGQALAEEVQAKSSGERYVYTALWIALTLVGVWMLMGTRSLYMGLILAWASPVLAGMAWMSTALFRSRRHVWALGIAVPTLYLWVVDRIAIGLGIWDISNAFSFDIDPLGLPIEEAVFFLVTNVLVVQGYLMLLSREVLISNNG